MKTILALL